MNNLAHVFVLTSTPALGKAEERKIIETAEPHVNRACEDLEISWPFNITIYPNAKWTVPETGEGGYTPSADWSQIYLDLTGEKHPVDHIISERMPVAIYHEMNHLKRWSTTGYGNDLESSLVSEGLAGVYERTMFPTYCVPWLHYTKEDVDVLLDVVRKYKKQSVPYVHNNWFFGSDPSIPKWLGYTVGHYIVSQAIEKNPSLHLIDLMGKSAREIIELSSVEL